MTPENCRQAGFTLIEIAVVLVLMALLASVVAVSARGMVGGVTHGEVIAQIGSLDHAARQRATALDGAVMVINPHDRQLTVRANSPQIGGINAGLTGELEIYQAPAGFKIERAWVLRGGQRDYLNTPKLAYDERGRSLTWGLTVLPPEAKPKFIVITGATGQLTIWESDEQVQDILARLGRRDAD